MRKREDKSLIIVVVCFAFNIGLFSLFLGNLNTAHAVTDNKRGALLSQDSPYTFEQIKKTLKLIANPLFISGYKNIFERDFKEALIKFQEILDKNPGDGDLYFIIGMIYYELNEIEEAINALNNALEYEGVMLHDFGSEFYGHFAMLHLLNEEYLKAVDLSKKAISLDPKNPFPHYIAGLAFNNLDKGEIAIPNFEKSIALKPDFYRAYNNLGISYQNLGQLDEAKESYEKAIELVEEADVTYYKAHMNLGNVYRDMGQYEKSAAIFENRIEMQPDDADIHYNLGFTYRKMSEYELAINSYEKTIELDYNYDKAFNNLGVVYYHMGNYDKALELYEKAFEINPGNEIARSNIADIYVELGEYDKAIAIFEGMTEENPANIEARYSLAMAYCNLDKADEALEEFYKIIAIDSEHINTNHSLAILNAELGNQEEATFYRDKAIELGVDFDEENLEMINNLR